MRELSWWSLIVVRQFLIAAGRLFAIMVKSRPHKGFPILTPFLGLLERLAAGEGKDTVGPALSDFIDAVEDYCPGAIDVVLSRPRDHRDLHTGDCLGPLAEGPARGVED